MGKKIAVTGGIGSGKSTALNILRQMQYPVYSCDEIYLEITQSATYIKEVEMLFPSCVINDRIDRKILSEIVFNDKEKREKLNALAHPLIMQTLLTRMDESPGFVFAEVPLLWEGNYQNLFDAILVVKRDKKDRIQAVIQRDTTTAEKVEGCIAAQVDYDGMDFTKICNPEKVHFIENNSSIENLENQIKSFLSSMKQRTIVKHIS